MRRHFRPLSTEQTPRKILGGESLHRLFAACCESAFEIELGVADPSVIDYMTDLLMRFVHVRQTSGPRTPDGTLARSFVEMSHEAEQRSGQQRCDLLRRVGDLTLFWTGVYPEALPKVQAIDSADAFLDLPAFGRRSYRAAASEASDGSLLWRLAEEYDVCRDGLHLARRTWEEMAAAN